MPTLILTRRDVNNLLDMHAVVNAVENAFRELAEGEATMPPKAYLLSGNGDFRAMPASLGGAAGIKWVCVFPDNPSKGLPTVIGTLIYNDASTGYPLAIMDATDLTDYRTGAAAAVASKHLARKDSRVLGIIGAGRQSHTQFKAHATLFRFERVLVADRRPEAIQEMIDMFPDFNIEAASIKEVASSVDILCTVTPVRQPIVKREWIKPGTHINAIGADASGKEELDPQILKDAAQVVVDDVRQSSSGGEINVPVKQGQFKVEDIYATLGEVVSGRKARRRNNSDITVFDSTGLAIQDIAVASLIYQNAQQQGGYLEINLSDE